MLMGMTDDLPASPWPAGNDARAAERLILQLKCAPTTFIYDLLLSTVPQRGSVVGSATSSSCRRDEVVRAPSALPASSIESMFNLNLTSNQTSWNRGRLVLLVDSVSSCE